MLRISFFSYLRMGRRRHVRLHTLKMAYSGPGMASPRAEPESAIFSKLLEYMVQAVSIFVSFQWGERSSRKRSQEPESRSEEAGMSLAQTGRCISRCSSALTERRRRSPPNPRIWADFSSMEPHFHPPILLPTVLGVVRSDRQCVSVSFDQGRHNALSLHLFGDCLGALRRNYRIRPGSTVIIGEAEQKKTSILVG